MNDNKKRIITVTVFLLASLFVLAFLSVCTGSVKMPLDKVFGALFNPGAHGSDEVIIRQLRIPRMLAAAILGGGLSVSGFLLQIFFRNPIAGPYVLGISSGAKLCVAIVLIAFLKRGLMLPKAGLMAASFAGAIAVVSVVLIISKMVSGMAVLVVCGVMMGYICSAATEFLITFADDSNIIDLHNWSMGSFSGITWQDVFIAFVCVGLSVLLAMFLAKPMTAFLMGEEYAISVGVNTARLKVLMIVLSSLLSAVTAALAGPVSFVGIAVPHLVKTLLQTSKPLIVVPEAFLGGAVFCLLCDLLARNLFAPTELSISSVTAVFGAPVVIIMLIGKRDR